MLIGIKYPNRLLGNAKLFAQIFKEYSCDGFVSNLQTRPDHPVLKFRPTRPDHVRQLVII